MSIKTSHPKERMKSAERREAILQAAIAEFAKHGLHGTSTVDIAEQVGISQPYIFRLFGTKKKLFIAAINYAIADIMAAFAKAVQTNPENSLDAMRESFNAFLVQPNRVLLMLQGFAAAADEDVRSVMRIRYQEIFDYAQQQSGASSQEVIDFLAAGLFLAVASAIDFSPGSG